jgi:hypothetical protein
MRILTIKADSAHARFDRHVRHNQLMKIIRNVIVILALSSVALATSACPQKKGPAQKAGEKIDNAVDKTKDAAKDATK